MTKQIGFYGNQTRPRVLTIPDDQYLTGSLEPPRRTTPTGQEAIHTMTTTLEPATSTERSLDSDVWAERTDRVHTTGSRPGVDHLDLLEAHAIFIMREVAAECERPVLLFSGGKDSAVLLRVAEKAFRPGRLPFPLLHVDTGHNFAEVIDFRDRRVSELGERLMVGSVQEAIDTGRVADPGDGGMRNRLQTTALLDAIAQHGFDACIGGARRDEDKARAKERVLSFRDTFGQWDPKRQRPELWQLYSGKVQPGEHLRAFPLSDWTELDIWQYIARESIELPSIYFAHRRRVIERDGMLLAESEWVSPSPGETVSEELVRFRTVGDATCTGAVRSEATSIEQIIHEVAISRVSERGATRADDRFSETSMEDRKREGYF
jgi:sulfate adenylyltransferase subunit 2